MIDSPEFAMVLWQRIKHLLPGDVQDGWQPMGLNERMRFLRYTPGDYFKPHTDGEFVRSDGQERSFLTLMLYLDEPEEGGETNFFDSQTGAYTSILPSPGLGLIFDHTLEHEGATLVKGVKHALRTDVMFRKRDSQPTAYQRVSAEQFT